MGNVACRIAFPFGEYGTRPNVYKMIDSRFKPELAIRLLVPMHHPNVKLQHHLATEAS